MATASGTSKSEKAGGSTPDGDDQPDQDQQQPDTATQDQAAAEPAGPQLVEYIVTHTQINRLDSKGHLDPLRYGDRPMLDPNDERTKQWLRDKAIVPANRNGGGSGQAVPNVAPGDPSATTDAPNGVGDGQPSSVQDMSPEQPQGTQAPGGPAGAHGTPAGGDGQGVPVS
jgi:hypothetical protein